MTVDPSTQVLPSKEAALFKSIISFHEHRQYKKGLKVCEQVLKKCPHHAETISMKGLFLGLLEKKEEGYECARQGIKNNFKSHVCWHVYGLLYRNDKNYEEAQKCYKTALRFDPENGQILRDLSILQLQTGSYAGHLETRLSLLRANPQVKSSWIALALAHHLVGDLGEAVRTLDQYLKHLSDATGVLRTTVLDLEMAEVHLYKAMVLEEGGRYEECLEHLKSLDFRGGDVLKYKTVLARMLARTGRQEQALPIYRRLFTLVPENLEFLTGIQQCHNIDLADGEQVKKFVEEMRESYPKSTLVKRNYLEHLHGSAFESAFKNYCLPLFKKGAPSVYNSVKTLAKDSEKAASMESVVSTLRQTFQNIDDTKAEFWAILFLAQHKMESDPKTCLSLLDEAMKLDETVPDLILLYAKLLSQSGMGEEAVQCSEHARLMDLGDRFLNAASVEYMLKGGKIDQAKQTIALFLKAADSLDKQLSDMADMQCVWFDLACGHALYAQQKYAEASTCFGRITRLFDDFVDDQLDFHNYALRKMNLTYYVEMLRYEQVIYREDRYREAAQAYIKCQLAQSSTTLESSLEGAMESLSLGDAKRNIGDLIGKLEKFHPASTQTHQLAYEHALSKENFVKAARALARLADLNVPVASMVSSLKTLAVESEEAIQILTSIKRTDASSAAPAESCNVSKLEKSDLLHSPALSKILVASE